jgi:hypothetical protein
MASSKNGYSQVSTVGELPRGKHLTRSQLLNDESSNIDDPVPAYREHELVDIQPNTQAQPIAQSQPAAGSQQVTRSQPTAQPQPVAQAEPTRTCPEGTCDTNCPLCGVIAFAGFCAVATVCSPVEAVLGICCCCGVDCSMHEVLCGPGDPSYPYETKNMCVVCCGCGKRSY